MVSSGNTALVTGAGKGIGAAIAHALAKDGFNIWLNYLKDEESAAATSRRIIHECGANCKLLKFDVRDMNAVKSVLEPLIETEVPYILVNNAGFARDCVFGLMDEESWTNVLDVHLNGFFNVTRTVLPLMMRKRMGRIINIVSVSGQIGVPGQVNYSAAKSGLIGATRSLATELARRNILVNAVSPGFIDTEMTRDIPKEKILEHIPLGRMGKPEEVAAVVSFLCSEGASYISGQVIGVNGGIC